MAENPQRKGARPRPLSPHMFIYRFPPTAITSITHRITGIGLGIGSIVLAWWLVAVANGPEAYGTFSGLAASPIGLVLLFGFTWALCFHLLNGIRHLGWDLGYGYGVAEANTLSVVIAALSLLAAAGLFALAYLGLGGFLR